MEKQLTRQPVQRDFRDERLKQRFYVSLSFLSSAVGALPCSPSEASILLQVASAKNVLGEDLDCMGHETSS